MAVNRSEMLAMSELKAVTLSVSESHLKRAGRTVAWAWPEAAPPGSGCGDWAPGQYQPIRTRGGMG